MKWQGHEQSGNVEDRRMRGKTGMAIGGAGALVIMLIAAFFNIDPNQLANLPGVAPGGGNQQGEERELTEQEIRTKEFAATILKFTEVVWEEQFEKAGETYQAPKMVLFYEQVQTQGCGTAPSAVGPFYCPADKTLYLDPTFFDELEQKLGGSKAEFSQAYVIAHEVGHHIQNLVGYNEEVRRQQAQLTKDSEEYNHWSVRLERQADYLAGVWAHYGQKEFQFIEPGDVDAAITTAKAIGDDRLQKRATGFVSPEGFTHGSSEQRVKWFKRGLETGDFSRLKALFDTPYNQL
jgi:predicted metalloprotease